MLVQLANEFEFNDSLAGSYEEENASESFIFWLDNEPELSAYDKPSTLNTKNKSNQTKIFLPTLFAAGL